MPIGWPTKSATNASRSIVWSANNFAFDRQVVTEGFKLNLGFPGQYIDDETKTWNNGFRDYRADWGRYVESDPIGLLAGLNTYEYVGGSPQNFIDMIGLSGTLVINSSGSGNDLSGSGGVSGHSWISYTPDGGIESTYGTWGNNPGGRPNGLEFNLELGRSGDATRAAHLTDEQEKNLLKLINHYKGEGEDAWGYTHPCSTFAVDAWNSSTGESLNPYGPYSSPSSLKNAIIDANGGANHGNVGPKLQNPWPM